MNFILAAVMTLLLPITSMSALQAYYDNMYEAPPPCYTPPATYLAGLSAHIDFLWWRAEEEDLSIGKEVTIERTGLNRSTKNYNLLAKKSTDKNLNFDYDPGFRIGLYYTVPGNCWDMSINWTHFQNSAKAHGKSNLVSSGSSENKYRAFVPYWESLTQNFPLHSEAKWLLDMDWLDLEVGHQYDIASHFSCRPFFGLRLANIDQKYHVSSNNHITGNFNGNSYDYISKSKAKCDFLGVGPRLGVDAQLEIGCGLSFFGQGAVSILFGQFDRHAHELFENDDFYYYQFNTYTDEVHSKWGWSSRVSTDLAIGLAWDHCFEVCQHEYPITLAVSWEHHVFYNFNNFNFESNSFMADGFTNTASHGLDFGPYANLYPTNKRHGDLYTQGLTFTAGVGF